MRSLVAYAAVYQIVTELVTASSTYFFGPLLCGDGDNIKTDFQRLLSRGPRNRRSSTAAAAAPDTRSYRLKVVQTKFYGYETKALSDSGGVSSFTSERLCDELNLKADRHPFGLTMAEGQCTSSIVIV